MAPNAVPLQEGLEMLEAMSANVLTRLASLRITARAYAAKLERIEASYKGLSDSLDQRLKAYEAELDGANPIYFPPAGDDEQSKLERSKLRDAVKALRVRHKIIEDMQATELEMRQKRVDSMYAVLQDALRLPIGALKGAQSNPEERAKALTTAGTEFAAREEARRKLAAEKVASLTKAQKSLQDSLDRVVADLAQSKSRDEIKRLKDARAQALAQLQQVETLCNQFKSYIDPKAELERQELLVQLFRLCSRVDGEAGATRTQIQRNDHSGALAAMGNPPQTTADAGALTKRHAELQESLRILSQANEIDRMSATEPKVPVVGEREATLAKALLDQSKEILVQKKLDDAALTLVNELLSRVHQIFTAAQAARATGLPLPKPPAMSLRDKVLGEVERRASELDDLIAGKCASVDEEPAAGWLHRMDALRQRAAKLHGNAKDEPMKTDREEEEKVRKDLETLLSEAIKAKAKSGTVASTEDKDAAAAVAEKLTHLLEEELKNRDKVKGLFREDTPQVDDWRKLPLGVIEALQGRIAALKAMSQADSAITPDVLKAYKEELESAVNSACSPEGKSKARQLGNKLVPNIDKLLNADVVIQFPPDGIGAIRERWHEVRADLLVSEPASGLDRAKEIMLLARDAHERAQALSERHAHVAALVVDLQKNFENSGTFIDGMQKGDAFFELVMNTEKLKKRLGALKTEIEAMPDPKRAEDLKKFNRAEKYLLGINQKMKADRGSTGHAPTEYYGPLRGELMEVRAMLANHDQTSIQAASDRFEEIRKEYVETTNSAGQSLRTPGAELDFILGYASSVSKSFIKKEEIEEKQKDFEQLAKDLKSAKSAVTKKETSKTAKALIISAEEQISGLRRSVENRQIEYSEAIEQAKALLERIKALSLDEKPEVSAKTKVAKSFQGLQSKCHQLADSAVKVLTSIRAKASVEDLKHYKDNIEHTEEVFADLAETWGKNGKILDALAELCDDENNELNSPGRFAISDVRRVREEALAALHRVLARAEADVGLRHYRANPVDAGQQFLILRGAFHELEIELLKSVDPRRKS